MSPRLAAALVGLAAALSLGGCGGGDDRSGDGARGLHLQAAGASVDLPAGWRRFRPQPPAVLYAAGRSQGGRYPLQLVVVRHNRADQSARDAVLELARPAARHAGGRLRDGHAVRVAGAEEAWTATTDSRRVPRGQHRRVAWREVVVGAERGARVWLLIVGGPRVDMTSPAIAAAIRSLRVGTDAGGAGQPS